MFKLLRNSNTSLNLKFITEKSNFLSTYKNLNRNITTIKTNYKNQGFLKIMGSINYNKASQKSTLTRSFSTKMESYNISYKGANPDHMEDIYELINKWTKDEQVPDTYNDAVNITKNYMQLRRSRFTQNLSEHPIVFDDSYAHSHRVFLEKMFRKMKPGPGKQFLLIYRCYFR